MICLFYNILVVLSILSLKIKQILLTKSCVFAKQIAKITRNLGVTVPLLKIIVLNLFEPGIHGKYVASTQSEQQNAIGDLRPYAQKLKQLASCFLAAEVV